MKSNASIVTLARLGRSLSDSKLRIGVLLDDGPVQSWAADTVASIEAAPELQLSGIFVVPASRQASRNLRERLFSWYVAGCLSLGERPQTEAADTPLLEVGPRRLSPSIWRDEIREYDLDVLLRLGDLPQTGACERLARCGVWSFAWGDPRIGIRQPAYYWDVANREPVSCVSLCVSLESFSSGRVIHRYAASTVRSLFFQRSAWDPRQTAKQLVLRRLYDVLEHGFEALSRLPEWAAGQVRLDSQTLYPSAAELARFIFSSVGRSAVSRWKNRRTRGKWFTAYRPRTDQEEILESLAPTGGFRELPSRAPDLAYADPCVVHKDGRDFIFVEEIVRDAPDRIAVYETSNGSNFADPPTLVLSAPHRLSYPCVFQHGSDYFLIPETAEVGRVELYRAATFPHEWALESVLAEGVSLVDTTPHLHEGTWYFFTASVDPITGTGIESLLFTSTRLDGCWRAHPANPISSDARNARMAGRLFRHGGSLIRPAQVGTPVYGAAIRLNEILELSPTLYSERRLEVIRPSWHPGSERTHTLSFSSHLLALDGWKRQRDPVWRAPKSLG